MEATKNLVALLKHDHPGKTFTSVLFSKNIAAPLHRDSYNDAGAENLVSPLKLPRSGGRLWIEGEAPNENFVEEKKVVNGKEIKSYYAPTGPWSFPPRQWHTVEAWDPEDGERITVVGYTVTSWRKLGTEARQQLEQLGFPLPKEEEKEVPKIRMVRNSGEQDHFLFEEFTEQEIEREIARELARDLGQNVDHSLVGVQLRKAEVVYTKNIEEILDQLDQEGKDLEVTHNVDLSEIRKNPGRWLAPAKSKAVGTVKPPGQDGGGH